MAGIIESFVDPETKGAYSSPRVDLDGGQVADQDRSGRNAPSGLSWGTRVCPGCGEVRLMPAAWASCGRGRCAAKPVEGTVGEDKVVFLAFPPAAPHEHHASPAPVLPHGVEEDRALAALQVLESLALTGRSTRVSLAAATGLRRRDLLGALLGLLGAALVEAGTEAEPGILAITPAGREALAACAPSFDESEDRRRCPRTPVERGSA